MHAYVSPNNKVACLTSVFISNELNLGVYCRILWNSRRTQQTPFCAICTLHSVEQFVVYRSQIFPKFKLKADTGVWCRNIAVINLVRIEGIWLLLTGKQSCQCHVCKEQWLAVQCVTMQSVSTWYSQYDNIPIQPRRFQHSLLQQSKMFFPPDSEILAKLYSLQRAGVHALLQIVAAYGGRSKSKTPTTMQPLLLHAQKRSQRAAD